ncbi:MAG: ABC transporter ATP-binding protein [Lachnospiraceae bacterium]|nr:ABC transporter ATP-binding protein [Lachnospiraceae bacterium]
MIRVNNVTKAFGKHEALKNVNCTFPSGSICGIVGSNGAGKSTLLRLISGVYKADKGEILIGEDPFLMVYENPEAKNKIFYLSDEPYFPQEADLNHMSSLYASFYPGFDAEYFNKITDGLKLDRNAKLSTFSKGMRRQSAVALALAVRSEYLLLDETFDGIDPIVRGHIRRVICEDVADRNTTVILTSHSIREMEDFCDQFAFIHKGGLLFEKDTDQLKSSLLKVQVAYAGEYDESRFEGFDVVKNSRKGSVTNLIVRGSREQVLEQLEKTEPLILDVLPLTLDEVFTYELEALGYYFDNEVEDKDENR